MSSEPTFGLQAVILAGGKGSRLRPYTTVIPKPLLPLGDVPILEVVLTQLAEAGVERVVITLGHLRHLFAAAIGDGSRFGLQIEYLEEREPLGTAGCLRDVAHHGRPLLVMNGDLLTDLHYRDDAGRSYVIAPLARRFEQWAALVKNVTICAPLEQGPPPASHLPYEAANIALLPVPRGGGDGLRAKLHLVRLLPGWWRAIRQMLRRVDAVHVRCPRLAQNSAGGRRPDFTVMER